MSEPEELPDIDRLENPGVSFEHGIDVYRRNVAPRLRPARGI
jgi:hypothetical protein